MKDLILLTDKKTGEKILIGTKQIIEIQPIDGGGSTIRSVGAMVTTNYVTETVEQINKLANK